MYSAKLTILDNESGEVYTEHTISNAKSAEIAYMAASELFSHIEHRYPDNSIRQVTVYKDGRIVPKEEYAEYFKMELFIDGESQGFIGI